MKQVALQGYYDNRGYTKIQCYPPVVSSIKVDLPKAHKCESGCLPSIVTAIFFPVLLFLALYINNAPIMMIIDLSVFR